MLNDDFKVQLGAELSKDAKKDIKSQLGSMNDLSVNVTGASLSQNIRKVIQDQLNKMSFKINLNDSSFNPSSYRKYGQQAGNLISDEVKKSLEHITSKEIGLNFVVSKTASDDFNRAVDKEIKELQSKKNVIVSVQYKTDTQSIQEVDSVGLPTGRYEQVEKLTGAVFKYNTETGEAITKTMKWAQVGEDISDGTPIYGWVQGLTTYNKAIEQSIAKTDNFEKKQKQTVANLTNTLNQISANALDPNASKSITSDSGILSLKTQIGYVENALYDLQNATSTTFDDVKIKVDEEISSLKILVRELRNAENIQTKLKSDKLDVNADKLESDFAGLDAKIKNANVSSQKLTNNVRIIRQTLERKNKGEILNKSDLEAANDALAKANNELKSLVSIKATNSALQKVKLDAQSVINELDEMSKKNPTFDSWEHEFNGVKITVSDLKKELLGITNSADLTVAKAKVNEFKSAYKTTIETVRISGEELDTIKKKLSDGTFQTQYDKLKAKVESFVDENGKAIVSISDLDIALENLQNKNNSNTELVQFAKEFTDECKKTDNQVKHLTTSLDKVVTVQQRLAKANVIDTFLSKNTRLSADAKQELEGYSKALRNVGTAMSKSTFNDINNGFRQVEVRMRGLGKLGASLSQQLSKAAESFTQWVSISSAIMLVVTKTRQAVTELKNVNTLLVEISKANDKLSKEDLASIGNNSFDVASRYGKAATSYLSGVQEASRAGYENAEAIAELSTAAQGAGDMTDDLANKMIIATDKAYKLGGSVEALRKILDGVNYITNHNAVNMTELSESLSIVGSTAASFGVEINELIAALGTMSATTQQSGSEVARAFRAILLNIRQVSDEEEGIDAEGLTKYEAACNALGVSLKETKNGIQELRDPMKVLEELSRAYEGLSEGDIRRTNLLNSVGGKMRATQLDALLRQWDTYSSMLQQYEDGVGSMAVEAEKTAQSWEGSLNRLNNTFNDTIGNIANSDAIITIINGFNGMLSVVNELTDATGSMNNVAAILGGIVGSQGLGLTNYVTFHSLRVLYCKVV